MQGSSSLRNNSASTCEREVMICPRCNMQDIRRALQSSSYLGRVYIKCTKCDKFLGWADVIKQNMEGKILSEMKK